MRTPVHIVALAALAVTAALEPAAAHERRHRDAPRPMAAAPDHRGAYPLWYFGRQEPDFQRRAFKRRAPSAFERDASPFTHKRRPPPFVIAPPPRRFDAPMGRGHERRPAAGFGSRF